MARSVLRVFAWFGILLFFFGILLHSLVGMGSGSNFIIFGLLILVATILLAMSPDILRKDQVTDVWSALIEKANGKAQDVLDGTVAFLRESKAPALEIAKKKVSTSLVGGILGNEREFLILTDRQKLSLRPYQIFINARDYGENLDVSWYLTSRPTIGQTLVSLVVRSYSVEKEISDLNVFDQQDVRAYVANAHRCMQKAVIRMMEGAGQDPSKIDWKSRGFLGIS